MSGMKIFKYRAVLPQLLNILVYKRLKFQFELIPYEANRLPWKKIVNFFLAALNQFLLPSRPVGYPVFAQIEPANFCNLSCPLCLTTSRTSSRPKALLPFDSFKKMIDAVGDYLLLLILWNWGEPFLNPDIFRMIAYAKSKGILVHCSTNGNVKFDSVKAVQLVESGLDTLILGVDGATQETYRQYRKGGDLEQVWENIRTLVKVKKEKAVTEPRLNLRFVVMRHNENEIPLIKQLARDLEVDFLSFKTVDMPPVLGKDLDRQYVPDKENYRRYEYKEGSYIRREKPFVCMRPWKRMTLDALGEVIPCEYDYRNTYSFGNIHETLSSMSIWKGRKAATFRKKFNRGWNDFYPCKECTYKNRREDDCTVEKINLRS